MNGQNELRARKIPMNNGIAIPALGFGTLIPDLGDTLRATGAALDAGFRQFDCSERYRNEEAVGEAINGALQAGNIRRDVAMALGALCGMLMILVIRVTWAYLDSGTDPPPSPLSL